MGAKIDGLTTEQKAELVSGKTFWRTYSFENQGIRQLLFSDGPAGLRVQSDKKADSMGLNVSKPSTCFPAHSALACSFDEDLVYEVASAIGAEAAGFGADILLAPAVNVKRSPLCGRNFEYFSEDPYLSGVLGREYIKGVQSSGTGACIKHFCANNKEYGRMVSDSAVDARTLREIYLTAFEIAIKGAKPAMVMTSYNRLNGVFCNENKFLLDEVLRKEWGFDGAVVSDWGGTHDRIEAIKAGADLEMPGCKFSVGEIEKALQSGELKEEELDACASRVAALSDRQPQKTDCDFEKNALFAQKCAEECAVLLKNDGVLPLSEEKIALVGDFARYPVYQGGGSSHVNPTECRSLEELFTGEKNFVGFARGYAANGKKSSKLVKKALKVTAAADVTVVVVGLSAGDAEGEDRENLLLPDNQIALLRALKEAKRKVVAVLCCGGAVETDWDGGINALLFAGLSGQGGAQAIKNLLYGKANPSGKLSETFPNKCGDVPANAYFDTDPYFTEYREGMAVGYRHFYGKEQKYPFGFGLSYTKFGYSNLSADESGVKFTVKNEGAADGAEVAQLYLTFPEAASAPEVQLKGFKKVFLKAGESKEIRIDFDEYTFRSYNATSGKWGIVEGEYKLSVGSSSVEPRLFAEIHKKGDMERAPAPQTEKLKGEGYKLNLNKKGRTVVDLHTPFCELKNSRALTVRLVSRAALAITKKNPTVGGTLSYARIRTGAQFARFDERQTEGLLDAFNGKYFRGAYKMIRGNKKKK